MKIVHAGNLERDHTYIHVIWYINTVRSSIMHMRYILQQVKLINNVLRDFGMYIVNKLMLYYLKPGIMYIAFLLCFTTHSLAHFDK